MSRVGNKPIALPDKVKISNDGPNVTVEGPKGKLEWTLPAGIEMTQDDGSLTVTREDDKREKRALHGTSRSLVQNMIIGVTEGFVKELEIQGVGLRAALKGRTSTSVSANPIPFYTPSLRASLSLVQSPPKLRLRVSTSSSLDSSPPKCVASIHPSPTKEKVSAMWANMCAVRPVSPSVSKGTN